MPKPIKINIAGKAQQLQETAAQSSIPSVVASRPDPEKIQQQHAEAPRRAAGRPTGTKRSLIDRSCGKTIFLEQQHSLQLDLIYAYNKLDRQDVIRCALDCFLAEHLIDGSHLDDAGAALVAEYHRKTHV